MSETAVNVLLVSYFNPLEPTSGSGFRSNSLLKNLCESGCNLDLFTFTDSSSREGWQTPPGNLRSLVNKRTKNAGLVAALRALLYQAPLAVAIHETLESIKDFQDFVLSSQYDVVIIDNLFAYTYRKYLKCFTGKTILYEHNAEYIMSYESFKIHKTVTKKIITYINTNSIKKYEHNACSEVDIIIHTSENDLKCFPSTYWGKSRVIPNTLPYCEEYKDSEATENNILFVGSMNHYPNVEGIVDFIKNAWIAIAERRKDLHLLIAGKNPPPSILEFDGRFNIHVLGFVEDIKSFYKKCKIAVTPINFGSGTRLKIIEAMMSGTMNIASEKGAEGLSFEEGKDIVIARNSKEWADSILYYVDNDKERLGIERNAHERAVSTYYYQNYKETVKEMISGKI
jgi:glycosyltransferase involved in cell wall biosynthesis